MGTSLCLVLPGFIPSSPHIPVMFSRKVTQSSTPHSVYHAREILPLLTAVKIKDYDKHNPQYNRQLPIVLQNVLLCCQTVFLFISVDRVYKGMFGGEVGLVWFDFSPDGHRSLKV